MHPSLRGHATVRSKSGFVYRVNLDIPESGITRRVAIVFTGRNSVPSVYSDGPSDSPHRYQPDLSLCMWYPQDPEERRWVFSDGLLDLLDIVVAHLFKEEWWRETGEWLGDEVPHEVPPMKEAS